MNNIFFRKAVIADANAVAAIVNAAYRGDSSRKGWTTEADLLEGARTDFADIVVLLEGVGSVILMAESIDQHSKHLLGTVHLERVDKSDAPAAFFGMFAIDPEFQAKGLGKQMMQSAEALVQQEWGARKMLMDVISVRAELIGFYERRGYRLTGEIRPFPVNPDLWTAKVDRLELVRMEKLLA